MDSRYFVRGLQFDHNILIQAVGVDIEAAGKPVAELVGSGAVLHQAVQRGARDQSPFSPHQT
jgi:hypothetical protein